MIKFSLLNLLFASIVALALACTPNQVQAQHRGRGSHGGSRGGSSHVGSHSHGSGGARASHGGGKFHGGGGSRGSVRSHTGGGKASSHGGGAFHGSGSSRSGRGGHPVGRNSQSGVTAGPSPRGGRAPGLAPAFHHPADPSSSRAFGANGSGNSQWHSFGSRGNASFAAARAPSTSIGDGQWHSFGGRGNASFGTARGLSSSTADGQWHSFASRGNSSFTTARGPSSSWQGSATRNWGGQVHQMPGNNFGSAAFSRSAAPKWSSNRAMTGSNRRFTEPPSRTTGSAISTRRVLSNIDHSRFGNSATDRFSFSNSRFGSHVPRFERPELGGRHEFRGGGSNIGFGRESSFSGEAFSFFPDLLGLALAFGSFGARGFGLPGFGLPGLALNLLESGFGSIGSYGGGSGGYGGYADGYGGDVGYGGYDTYGGCSWTPSPISPFWGPGVIPYQAENVTCPQ